MNHFDLWSEVKLYAALFVTWLAGASGQVALAGAAGGLVRWWLSERRKIIAGLGAVVTGAIFAKYFAPLTLSILERTVGPLGEGAFATAAFAAGLGGMSIAKIIIAAIEGASLKIHKGGDDENS
ncbi:hypothetical protein CEW89_08360 [Celeribacter ethanolicus]|uniref:Holin n=1 Tax=Celeribacter ethanolicus TaxID=1758178 RepID=A0A291GBL5_9RHOB|nr:hypothetical protein [Celeribacter ethanolicus]ATG47585.1 hypothetical protein CEW89_08360 [Celeribacter ethanolicus]